jgi:hypothetical protein
MEQRCSQRLKRWMDNVKESPLDNSDKMWFDSTDLNDLA